MDSAVKYFCTRVAVVSERSRTIVPKRVTASSSWRFYYAGRNPKNSSFLHLSYTWFSFVDLYFYVSEEFELTHIQSRTGLNGNRNNNKKQTSSFLLCLRFFSPKAPAKKTRQKSASVCVFKSRYVEKCIGLLCHKLLSFLVYYTINEHFFEGGQSFIFWVVA